MPIRLKRGDGPNDRSTFVLAVAFADEAGAPVTPGAATWTLLNGRRQVVNERDAVPLAPAESVTILLGADDLDHSDGDVRHLVLDWLYDSDLGTGLAGREQVTFYITDILEKVS